MASRWSSGWRARPVRAGALALAVSAAAACSPSASSTSGTSGTAASGPVPARTLAIVAGENFWGSLAAQLAGRAGRVTSVLTDPNADPHQYESSSDDARAFATADYVVVNGAGYDTWAQKLLSANPNRGRRTLVVADLLGRKEGDNPHFWYDPTYVTTVADRITADLKTLDPADSAYLDAQRQAFDRASEPYRDRLASIKASFAGTPVGSTESVFAYLADHLGLTLVSPPGFMAAVAEGNDPPAGTVTRFEDQVTQKRIRVLVYNRQTSTAVTTNLTKLAAAHGVPTVGITETVQPPGASFEEWQAAQLERLQQALEAGGQRPQAPAAPAP